MALTRQRKKHLDCTLLWLGSYRYIGEHQFDLCQNRYLLPGEKRKKSHPQMVLFARKTISAEAFTRKFIVLLFHTISPADKLRINHEVPPKPSPSRQSFCQNIPIGKSITSTRRPNSHGSRREKNVGGRYENSKSQVILFLTYPARLCQLLSEKTERKGAKNSNKTGVSEL